MEFFLGMRMCGLVDLQVTKTVKMAVLATYNGRTKLPAKLPTI